MNVGFFSPLPPARTGVADYSAALLEALRRFGPVKPHDARADICLYHLGNNHLHREIYPCALEHPGVIVLHDASLHHFFLGSLDRAAYIQEFIYNYGEWARDLAADLWANRARSAQDPRYFQYAMLRRIAERSLAVIVHNPAAARIVKAHAPAANVIEIPHLFRRPALPEIPELLHLRDSLGLRLHTCVFGIFGYLRESKRLAAIFRVFDRLRGKESDIRLLIAGDFASDDLARSLEPYLADPAVLRFGYTREPDFWRVAGIVDACINLKYPAAGETSGIAIRLMGIGKPVLLTNAEENSGFPASACIRIDSGPAEEEMLAAYMLWIAANRNAAGEIGRRAAAHICACHSVETVARDYWNVLSGVAP